MEIENELPRVKKNILLKNYTTFKIGGPAKYFFVAKNKKDLIKAVSVAKKNHLPFFVLGGGSNLLISDAGYKGLVIKMQNIKYKIKNKKIYSEVGVPLSSLAAETIKHNLTGLEWATGIPGTVGGAIYGNAGAFKKSMKDIIKKVEIFDTKIKKIKIFRNKNLPCVTWQNLEGLSYSKNLPCVTWQNLDSRFARIKDCKFNYRESIFKKNKNLVILSAEIQLKKGNINDIKKKIQKFSNYRKQAQPLNLPSIGSIFKNFTPYRNTVSGTGPKLIKELNKFKKIGLIPAAWLIEKCGLEGKEVGNVKISEKHANFIVNLGNGKAKDVKKLINLVKKRVKEKFGVKLEEEIQYLGFKN